MGSRRWVVVINNWTTDMVDNIKILVEKNPIIRVYLAGKEIAPTTGTPHLQGYMELRKPQRASWFKSLPPETGLPGAHVEVAGGSRVKNWIYCTTDDKDPYLFGKWDEGGQGTRNDLKDICTYIREDAAPKNIRKKEIMETFPLECARYGRFVEEYKGLCERDETRAFRQVTVAAIVGDTGKGKTRLVDETEPDLFRVNCDEDFPFNGYDGEEAILIDDFYGGLKYGNLLRILDGYQYRCNVKHGHRYARWKRVYITSNNQPSQWYHRGLTPALKRRLSFVTEFRNEEEGNTRPPPLLDIPEYNSILSALLNNY